MREFNIKLVGLNSIKFLSKSTALNHEPYFFRQASLDQALLFWQPCWITSMSLWYHLNIW